MNFQDAPNLSKFEKFVGENPEDETVQHAYSMVAARLEQVEDGLGPGMIPDHGPEQLMAMKDRCAAVEESTRIIWACAAATGNIDPPMWEDGCPDFHEAVEYFWSMPDLEWMELTHIHRILWEKRIGLS